MHRVHVINISPSQLKDTLAKLKTIYPESFISKLPKVKSEQMHPVQPVKKLPANYDKAIKYESIKPYEPSLDSNTILKTRKSFL